MFAPSDALRWGVVVVAATEVWQRTVTTHTYGNHLVGYWYILNSVVE